MAATLYHPSSTCAMGTVVNSDLQVMGVEGLRVADASVFPHLTSGNTNAPAIMVGEMAADIIKKHYGLWDWFDSLSYSESRAFPPLPLQARSQQSDHQNSPYVTERSNGKHISGNSIPFEFERVGFEISLSTQTHVSLSFFFLWSLVHYLSLQNSLTNKSWF
jgi:hypothetical protein